MCIDFSRSLQACIRPDDLKAGLASLARQIMPQSGGQRQHCVRPLKLMFYFVDFYQEAVKT